MFLALGTVVVLAPVNARADEWNKATTLTFNRPVEVPGMVLGAGTYVFRLADTSDRNVVQILNADESHLYENVLAVPAYRENPTDKTAVTFEERAKGSPEAIATWFYPGDNYGQEFVYPKAVSQVASLAPVVPAGQPPVRPKPAAAVQQVHKPAEQPVVTAAPQTEPVQIAQNSPPAKPAATPAATPAPAPTDKQAAKKLPRTASPVPTLMLIGLLSLAGSAGIRVLSKHSA
jgi:outer membrane biosynthesis protein TonB